MNSDYYSWKSKFFLPGDIWPFNLVSEFLENSMLHINQENCFISVFCSFRRIGSIVTRKSWTNSEYLTSVRVEKHFEFIHCDWHQNKPISAASRPFHAIAWISVFFFTREPVQSSKLQEIVALHEKIVNILRQFNRIVRIMRSVTSFVFATYSILQCRLFKRKARY